MAQSNENRLEDTELTERLRKILLLERRLGFSNRAVVGGLDKFLQKWAREASQTTQHPMVRSALKRLETTSPDYAAKPAEERRTWVDRVLRWTGEIDGEAPVESNGSSVKPAASQSRRVPAGSRRAPAGKPPFLRPGQELETPLAEVRGIPTTLVGKLEKLGVATVWDLLHYFPRRHIDFTNTQPIAEIEIGRDQTAIGSVWQAEEVRVGNRRRGATEAVIGDNSGNIRAIWFNQPYVAKALRPGMRIALSGRVSFYKGRKVFENPEYEVAGDSELVHTGRLVPVYPLTEGVTSRRLRGLTKRVVDECAQLLEEFIPEDRRGRLGLMGLTAAVRGAHFPNDVDEQQAARHRLAFDELLLIQLGVLARKRTWREEMPGHPLHANPEMLDAFLSQLPFGLTGAQERAMGEIMDDLARSHAMSRLLQGEVGSGKTVVALAASLVAVAGGQQVAFMAPTEILSEQHFRTVKAMLGYSDVHTEPQDVVSISPPWFPKPITVGLLLGSHSRKRKQGVQALAAKGEIDILIGTQALFQRDVEFADLAFAIVDEQHRFGVMQRSELRQKGYNPHLLVMTATPIPRTLSLTVYGDLDISVLDELPPGRQQVRTKWLASDERDRAYSFVRKQAAEGRQVFIVYPLVEESDKLELAAALQEHERLSRDIFPDLRLALLHGRMKTAEKDGVMRDFGAGEYDVLVATSVVEVGIDVPNATVMLVDGADRFGLTQLHQFRGRVGRGQHESFCILISESPSPEASERLGIIERVHDGFELAEEDLRLRGAGEFFGTRQSGLPDLRMARMSDAPLLEEARREAISIFEDDPTLERTEWSPLSNALERAWRHRTTAVGEA
jgi:ATP-dependent DNA helicase RecG